MIFSTPINPFPPNPKPTLLPNFHGDCHVIYQLPSIRVLRLIMRLKLFQTAIVVLAVPPVCYMYSQEQLSSTNASLIVGTATFAIFMLYAMSFWLRRMIGRLSLNTTGDMVHLAHMTFWGRRKEVILPVRNLMALSAKTRRGEPLVQIRRYDSQEVFYLSLRFGRIVDKRRFEQVFGSIK
uniref:Transmembrane protein 186 n=1 Tax=Eptatretus burgeri TaxID=7764 RepID=A0A8C4NP58_EPTBU